MMREICSRVDRPGGCFLGRRGLIVAEAGLMFSLTVGTWTGICTSGPCRPSTQKGDGMGRD